MTKYPEGQWEATVNTLGRQIVRRQVDEWDWEVIAFCVGDNCEADACFIADAPETAAERDRLREALEGMLSRFGDYPDRGEITAARAAIAAAKGEMI